MDLVGYELWSFGHLSGYKDLKTNSNLTLCGGTPKYAPNNTHYIQIGCNLTQEDIKVGRNVVVIGAAVADRLFPWADPIQKVIKIDGQKFTVVGVFKSKKSALRGNYDNYLLIPISAFKRCYGERDP